MQYQLHQLDGRHSHNDRFQYYLGFPTQMTNRSGPLHFNDAMTWFINNFGWSAEIHQICKIEAWTTNAKTWNHLINLSSDLLDNSPDYCNQHWSWTNTIGHDLRIYVRGDQELAWFQLSHPG